MDLASFLAVARRLKHEGRWGGVVVVAHEILVSAQGALVFGIWVWGFGLDNTYDGAFTIKHKS